MGSCGISSSANNSVIINNTVNNLNSSVREKEIKKKASDKNTKYLEEDKLKFPDLEEYPDIYVGEGIKRIKAFKFNKPYDILNKMIIDFWTSRNERKNIWVIIKQALDADHIQAKNILFKNNIFPAEGCINLLIDQDDNLYRIPNFCICEPLVKKEILDKEKIKEEKIKITLCNMRDPKNMISVKIPTNIACLELKKMYCKIKNLDIEKYRIKAFLLGTEMLNDNLVGQYNIHKDSKIQLTIDEIIPSFKSSKQNSINNFDYPHKLENNSDTKIDGKFEAETKRSVEINDNITIKDSKDFKENYNYENINNNSNNKINVDLEKEKNNEFSTPKKENSEIVVELNTDLKYHINNTISEYNEYNESINPQNAFNNIPDHTQLKENISSTKGNNNTDMNIKKEEDN